MARARGPAARQRRDVDPLGLEPGALLGLGQDGLLLGDRLVHLPTGLPDELAGRGLLLLRHGAHRGVHPRECGLLAGVLGPGLLQLGHGRRGTDGGEGLVHGGGDGRFADLEVF
ncbi:hypothetical protein Cus16_0840 [Curtobacterium sp. ER1/6]|nr:hypothetical protein Cus16_0840 [Curtobacterium sp. ER1/6]